MRGQPEPELAHGWYRSRASPFAVARFLQMILDGSDPYQGPSDTNMGVTFTGRLPGDPEANIAPMTKDSLNLLSYGGGNELGAWSLAAVQWRTRPIWTR